MAPLRPLEFAFFQALRVRAREAGPGAPLGLVLAVSGGRDSMALLEVVARVIRSRLWSSAEGAERHVAARVVHFNHRTRPGPEGNEADLALVLGRSLSLGLPVSVHALDLEQRPRGNFHDVARTWRYAVLEKERAALHSYLAGVATAARPSASPSPAPSTWILTAHHARDTVETMLLRLARGTGPDGLLGIPIVSPELRLWRPFANTPYAHLDSYAHESGLTWREDPTNDALDYDRNKVRHGLLPTFERLNPMYEDAFLRFATALDDTVRAAGRSEGDARGSECSDGTGGAGRRSPPPVPPKSSDVGASRPLVLRATRHVQSYWFA